ncbi:MAG TPA: diacylglycerol kinase family protein [Blastocatellia bacterium]|nr:diacylglycerol kinase family protein [Blastocatellia bacterium]
MSEKRATIIYNPMSGRPARRADNARRMVELLAERGIQAEARATAGPDDATRLAREAVNNGSDIIISYGGDGTLNEVLQGIVGTRAALAVWAGGTANVVARDLCLPTDVEQLAEVIAAGKTSRITLGLASGVGESEISTPRPMQRYFFMFAGIGLDASIARKVNPKLKRRTGEFAFWLEGIKHILTWRAEKFVIEIDGKKFESVFALIGNGKGYGGGFCLAPNARLEEPMFEVYIVPKRSTNFAYLRDLAAVARGNPAIKGVNIVKGRHVKANSSHEPWVEVDGELIGPLPMTFDVVPDALSVIVP